MHASIAPGFVQSSTQRKAVRPNAAVCVDPHCTSRCQMYRRKLHGRLPATSIRWTAWCKLRARLSMVRAVNRVGPAWSSMRITRLCAFASSTAAGGRLCPQVRAPAVCDNPRCYQPSSAQQWPVSCAGVIQLMQVVSDSAGECLLLPGHLRPSGADCCPSAWRHVNLD